jgi:ABC-type polysaccharide/polyol phosphate export permease
MEAGVTFAIQGVLRYLRCVSAAFRFQCIDFTRNREAHFTLLQAVPPAVLLAYISTTSLRPLASVYIFYGVLFLLAWNNTVYRVGSSLGSELYGGTLDISLISRAPTSAVILGRALALTCLGLGAGLLGLITVAVFMNDLPPADDGALLAFSLIVGAASLLSLSFLLSPITLLGDFEGGFYAGLLPLLFLFSGVIFPASRLPGALEFIPRLFPTSWAMEAIAGSAQGSSQTEIMQDWLGAMAICTVFFAGALLGISHVEHRIRVTGDLGRS